MRMQTEVTKDPSITLIIGNPNLPITQAIVSYFQSQEAKVVLTSHIPPVINPQIIRCFCLTDIKHLSEDAVSLADIESVTLVSSIEKQIDSRLEQTIRLIVKHYPHVKIALIPVGHQDIGTIIERLVYFALDDKSKYTLITSTDNLRQSDSHQSPKATRKRDNVSIRSIYVRIISKPFRFVVVVLLVVLLVHLVFLIPLSFSVATTYWQASHIVNKVNGVQNQSNKIVDPFSKATTSLLFARRLYNPIRRGWLFLGLASYPERAFTLTEEVIRLYHITQQIREDASIMMAQIMDPKSLSQDQISVKHKALRDNLQQVLESNKVIRSQMPQALLSINNVGNMLTDSEEYINLGLKFIDSFEEIFAKNSEKLYVILFANDREIRPGGGFIGSFALIRVKNLQIQEWKIYDVYDADGQLKARVKPPEAISEYLKQPFFFLRDSAFTPDFPSNVVVAEDFLQKELGINRLDGALLFTFSSIEKLIGDIGYIDIPEYQERVTEENMYMKTQLYAEKNFFPGSTQKKNFIEALINQLIIKIEEPKTAYKTLQSIVESLDQKLVTAYFRDPTMQAVFDQYYWSGRQLPPSCITDNMPPAQTCVPLYTYPVEANLGVNKANAFVTRDYTYKVRILSDTSTIESEFITNFFNNSYPDVFPGGTYKNYYQVYLPPNISIQSIMINDMIAKSPEIEKGKYTRVALFIEIPSKTKVLVSIKYRTLQTIPAKDSQIQVIFQKQIGIPTSEISFKFGLPTDYSVKSTNFSPLAQNQLLEYNSTVDSDKFYYLHF